MHGWAWAGWFWLQQGHLSQNSSKNVFFFVKSILQPELWKTESQSLTKLLLLLKHDLRSRHGKRQFFLPEQGLSQNYFTQKSAYIATKSECETKQRKMYLTTSMSKIRLPHVYRGNNYVINLIVSSF